MEIPDEDLKQYITQAVIGGAELVAKHADKEIQALTAERDSLKLLFRQAWMAAHDVVPEAYANGNTDSTGTIDQGMVGMCEFFNDMEVRARALGLGDDDLGWKVEPHPVEQGAFGRIVAAEAERDTLKAALTELVAIGFRQGREAEWDEAEANARRLLGQGEG